MCDLGRFFHFHARFKAAAVPAGKEGERERERRHTRTLRERVRVSEWGERERVSGEWDVGVSSWWCRLEWGNYEYE